MQGINKFIFIILSFFSMSAMALTKFPKGNCKFEGYIYKDKNLSKWVFSVNKKSNAETSFILNNVENIPELEESGQFRLVSIQIKNDIYSSIGEADFSDIVDYLNPYEEPKQYLNSFDIKKSCTPLK